MSENENTFRPELYEEDEFFLIEEHIKKYFGDFENVYHEILSPDIHVDIAVIPPRAGHNYYTLATMGMGAHRMRVPDDLDVPSLSRAELLINLPPDWPLDEEGFFIGPEKVNEHAYWPIRWLKTLARLPGSQETWLGWGHTVPTGARLAGTNFRCLLLLNPGSFDNDATMCAMPDGTQVNFYQVVPLYEEEMNYKLDKGTDALLEIFSSDVLEVVHAERPNVAAALDPLYGIPFAERVENFWRWFSTHESELSDMVENHTRYASEEIVAFVEQGTDLIAPGISFNLGGDFEFTFAVEGREHLFYLLPRITAAMPPEHRQKWTCHPWMPGRDDGGFSFRMFDVDLNEGDVTVRIAQEEEPDGSCSTTLYFYAEALAPLDADQRRSAYCILLDNYLGEGLSYRYIDRVAAADEPEPGMFPLADLRARITGLFAQDGKTLECNPSERYFTYEREADEDDIPRFDIFMGIGSYMPLVNEYYQGAAEGWRHLAAFGAKPFFLYYFHNPNQERRETLDERYEIQDELEALVLGAREHPASLGIVLGAAMGERAAYIDLLVYDEARFLNRVRDVLDRFPHAFYLSEFRMAGDEIPLFDVETPDLEARLNRLHDAGLFQRTADAILDIPEHTRPYGLTSLLGRALNNLERPHDAYEVLSAISAEGRFDPLWHFRIGYALYYMNREAEAATHFRTSIELGLDDEQTRYFLEISEEEARDRANFEARRAHYTPRETPFEGFDLSDFWDDDDYAEREFVGRPATDEMVDDAESELGYKLPASYIWLMQRHNGGIPFKNAYPTANATSWARDHVAISGIFGIDPEKRHSLCGEFGSTFMIEDWNYPNIGFAICDCPSAGHDMIFLDYRYCGPDGEPEVVHVDQENDYRITYLADDFESFIRGLVSDETFE